MAIQVPQNPSDGDLFPDIDAGDAPLENGRVYVYDAAAGVWNLLSGDGTDDEYVLKKGDTMTGALTMDTADHIHMINTDLDFQATMDDDGSGTWDAAVDRFLDVESMVPQIVAADGSTSFDYSDSFGINFKINAGNTGKNRLKVSNRYGDIVTFKGGTGPQLVFSDYEDPTQGGFSPPADSGLTQGIPIRGIPTPDHDNSPSDIAVNKEYVDGRDHILQEEIIILQEEINALTTLRDSGIWKDAAANIPPEGHFSMRRAGGQVTADYTQTDINFVVIHKTSFDGHVATFAGAEVGDYIQLLDIRDGHFGQFEIKTKDDQSSTDYVSFEVQHLEGLGSTQPEDEVIIRIFEPPSGGTASEFVKKIGDTMTGNLEIKKDPNTTAEAAAALTLKGRRTNATDSSATIAFSNENVSEASRIGYLTYRSYGTSQSFQFNKNVTITGHVRADYDITTGGSLKGINRTNNVYRSQNIDLGSTTAGYLKWDTHSRLVWSDTGGSLHGGANDGKTMLTWDGDGGMARYSNSRRIVWNSTGGSLNYGDTTEVLKWSMQGVDQLRLNSSTGSTGQVPTKTASGIEWSDNVKDLEAKIEELEQKIASLGGGGSTMNLNLQLTLSHRSSYNTSFNTGTIVIPNIKTKKIHVIGAYTSINSSGKINITDAAESSQKPVIEYHIIKATNLGPNDRQFSQWELDVALATLDSGFVGYEGLLNNNDMNVALIEGAVSLEPIATVLEFTGIGEPLQTNQEDQVVETKFYRLSNSGTLQTSGYHYGNFYPYKYIENEKGVSVTTIEGATAKYSSSDAVIEETTFNGIDGISVYKNSGGSVSSSNANAQMIGVTVQPIM